MTEFHTVAKALADPQRFDIFELILGQEGITCGEVVERCPISQATVSHHLKVLADSGLIAVRRDGQRSMFTAHPSAVEDYIAEFRRRTAA
jgi:ArsR family transcriptional regulator